MVRLIQADLEQYFTSPEIALQCINKTKEVLGDDYNKYIKIDPCSGSGAFSSQIDNCIAYDIEPQAEGIIKRDFLNNSPLFWEHPNAIFISNIPFGSRKNSICYKFIKKCIELQAEYIAFILPAGYYNNHDIISEYKLIHSEILECEYYILKEDRYAKNIKTSFCIWKRDNDRVIKKEICEFVDITISERGCIIGSKNYRQAKEYRPYILQNEILRICQFGAIGKICEYSDRYCSEYIILRNNKTTPGIEKKVIEFFNNETWQDIKDKCTSAPSLAKKDIIKKINNYLLDF